MNKHIEEAKERFESAEVSEGFWLKEFVEGKSQKVEILNDAFQILKPFIWKQIEQELKLAYKKFSDCVPEKDRIECTCGCDYNDCCLCKEKRIGYNQAIKETNDNLNNL